MGTVFQIPDNPNVGELQRLLTICSNQIATITDLAATYKADAAIKTTAFKRAVARATVKYRHDGTAAVVKALVEIDPDVVAAGNECDNADAIYGLAKAELDGYEAHFVALRKISELRKTEMKSFGS